MKTTRYFDELSRRSDRKGIRTEWIEAVISAPEREVVQADGRIRRWARIPEAAGRALRVILLPDGETIHNVFFDRRFRP
jgi:hypothetical protein